MKVLRGGWGPFLNELEDEETGEGILVVCEGGENITVEDVLNATGQALGNTNYRIDYKDKIIQGGTISLRILSDWTCKDRNKLLSIIMDLGHLPHENIAHLREFCVKTKDKEYFLCYLLFLLQK